MICLARPRRRGGAASLARELRDKPAADALVFALDDGAPLARGSFAPTSSASTSKPHKRRPIRVHDLRGSFATLALANGR